jgi:sec-independent protein translocase protein TatB
MFDIGWSEMALVLLVALIVIGPKDLPRVARTVGQWVGKGRAMAREFQRALEDMAREAELDKVKSEIEKAGRTNLGKTIENTIDPSGELTKAFDPKADSKAGVGKAAGVGKPTSGDRPAGTEAQGAQAARAPAAPVKPESPTTTAVNGAGVAAEAEAPARKSTRAAPAKRKRRAAAGNGADAADDTKKPAPETAPAESN